MNLTTFNERYNDSLPDAPGVYFFIGKNREILYIGKATSLKDRVRSYFIHDMLLLRGPKIVRMLERARSIRFRRTESVLEALLVEAELIKKHQPPYNTDVKDDKSWNVVVITREKFPRILVKRGKTIGVDTAETGKKPTLRSGVRGKGGNKRGGKPSRVRLMFGPFPNGQSLRDAVKIVRRIFPFRDTCMPLEFDASIADKTPSAGEASRGFSIRKHDRGCFNYQIGLCPGVCVGVVSPRDYARTIRHISLFFSGKRGALIRLLEREMREAARGLRFERAAEIKKTLFALGHIRDVALLTGDIRAREAGTARRIEGYDVAHLGGSQTVGVMTVVKNGHTDPSSYRKFILRGEAKGNDLSALEELLRRRFAHSEWTFPDMIVVDGGDTQRSVAEAFLFENTLSIPVFSVVKDDHHRQRDIAGGEADEQTRREMFLVNAEAHRFAISFHRKRRNKEFLSR